MDRHITERLSLRPMVEADYQDFFDLLTTPELCIHLRLPQHQPEEGIRRSFHDFLQNGEMHRILCRTLEEPAGFLRISPARLPGRMQNAVNGLHGVSLTFMLYAPYRRRGWMTELLSALVPALLREGAGYLHCAVDAFQPTVPGMLRKLGFRSFGSVAEGSTRYVHYLITTDDVQNPCTYADFPDSGRFAAVACMLHCHGVETTASALAQAMLLPCLFVREDERYLLGSMLAEPPWLNLALLPMGFRMVSAVLPREETPAFLSHQRTALLALPGDGRPEPYVFLGSSGRYMILDDPLPGCLTPHLRLTPCQLLKLLPEEPVTVSYLVPCKRTRVRLLPHILRSYRNVLDYVEELGDFWDQPLSREAVLPYLRSHVEPLALHFLPMAAMTEDPRLISMARTLQELLHTELYSLQPFTRLNHLVPRFALHRLLLCYLEFLLDVLAQGNLPDREIDQLAAMIRFPIEPEPSGCLMVCGDSLIED